MNSSSVPSSTPSPTCPHRRQLCYLQHTAATITYASTTFFHCPCNTTTSLRQSSSKNCTYLLVGIHDRRLKLFPIFYRLHTFISIFPRLFNPSAKPSRLLFKFYFSKTPQQMPPRRASFNRPQCTLTRLATYTSRDPSSHCPR